MSDMPLQVEAVYENGVLRPLQPLGLREHERVIVSVSGISSMQSTLAAEYIERIKRRVEAEGPTPGLAEVQRRMAKIPGSMADLIVAERGDR